MGAGIRWKDFRKPFLRASSRMLQHQFGSRLTDGVWKLSSLALVLLEEPFLGRKVGLRTESVSRREAKTSFLPSKQTLRFWENG